MKKPTEEKSPSKLYSDELCETLASAMGKAELLNSELDKLLLEVRIFREEQRERENIERDIEHIRKIATENCKSLF